MGREGRKPKHSADLTQLAFQGLFWHILRMKISWFSCCLLLLWALTAHAQENSGAILDTNFYVAGVTDWKGNLTVQVLPAVAFDDLKKAVALDNRALNYAYQNMRSDWRTKYGTPTPTDPKPKVPPFPLKRPTPRIFHFYAKLPTSEAAEQKKTDLEERETARQKRTESAKEKALALLPEKQQDAIEEKASSETELLEKLVAEIKDVKWSLETGNDPVRKQDRTQANGTKTNHKLITVHQGPRLGDIGGDMVKDSDLVEDGPLKKPSK
jgi:hypothetical protein